MRLSQFFIIEGGQTQGLFGNLTHDGAEENVGSGHATQLFPGSVEAIMQRNDLAHPDDVSYDVINGELFAFSDDVEMSYWVPQTGQWEYS